VKNSGFNQKQKFLRHFAQRDTQISPSQKKKIGFIGTLRQVDKKVSVLLKHSFVDFTVYKKKTSWELVTFFPILRPFSITLHQ